MLGFKNSKSGTLILASVLALSGGYAMGQPSDNATGDGERPMRRQADGERGQRGQRGDRGEGMGQRGERGERGETGPRGRRDPGDFAKRLFAGMELTDEQKTQIREIMKTHGEERKAWHEEHKEEFQAIREKMREARGDQEAMEALRKQVHALMDSAPKPDATHDEIRALLNEEQQATFDERVEKMRERMEQWRERRKDGPPPGPGMGPDGDGPPPPGARRGGPGGRIFGNLDLDDDQRAEMRELMQSDMTREEKMEAVKGILTEEQKAQLEENIEKMRQLREERQGERGDRPGRGDGPRGDRPGRGGGQGGGGQLDL